MPCLILRRVTSTHRTYLICHNFRVYRRMFGIQRPHAKLARHAQLENWLIGRIAPCVRTVLAAIETFLIVPSNSRRTVPIDDAHPPHQRPGCLGSCADHRCRSRYSADHCDGDVATVCTAVGALGPLHDRGRRVGMPALWRRHAGRSEPRRAADANRLFCRFIAPSVIEL